MFDMYKIIEELCIEKSITITEMCRELKINRSSLSELKQGRAKSLSADKVIKIAEFFSVSPAYITGDSDRKTIESKGTVTDDDIKFALFGDVDIDDEVLEEVRHYAQIAKQMREERKKDGKT